MQDIENLIRGAMPSYLIVRELPKRGEFNTTYVLDKKDCIEIYDWYEDGYRLLDTSIKERELVRCKDCKYHQIWKGRHLCDAHTDVEMPFEVEPYGFCNLGARK